MSDSDLSPLAQPLSPRPLSPSPAPATSSPAPETAPAASPSPEPEPAAATSPETEQAAAETETAVSPSPETESAMALPDQELASEDPSPVIEAAEMEEPVGLPASDLVAVAGTDNNKRKLDDLAKPIDDGGEKQDGVGAKVEEKAPESVMPLASDSAVPEKRQRLDGETDVTAGDEEMRFVEAASVVGNGQRPAAESEQVTQLGCAPTEEELVAMTVPTSRKFEIPNNKVGVLIGKAGETIKVLQHNSGAKIQITRDNEADPNSSSRPVELIGTLECINKAEKLIKDVIAEADAGGSPALVARGFGNAQSGSEQHELHVPNEKVGWIIGKGGETIKNLQTRSGARIQLIPQHLPAGESPKERLVRISGYKKQIDDAKEMIKEVMNQSPGKHGNSSGGYNQQPVRPRGPGSGSQWGSRNPAPAQQATAYDYQQRGMYPPQGTQYPSQAYGSYTQHMPPRSGASAGWDQRAGTPVNNYYGQGGQGADNQSIPAAAPSQAPVNYNYGPSQPTSYGQQTPYAQSASTQQYYGQQPVNSQPGSYPQQGGTQVDYAQHQPYNVNSQSYGPPQAATQSSNPMYQGSAPYGSGMPSQQAYPYSQTAPTQSALGYGQAYGPSPGQTDGYAQPPAAAGYPQQASQVAPGYAQSGQAAPTYAQTGVQAGGYGQYPPQQGYDQSVPSGVNYGYQGGPGEAGYAGNSVPSSGYAAAPASNQAGYGQTGYPQPQTYPTGY